MKILSGILFVFSVLSVNTLAQSTAEWGIGDEEVSIDNPASLRSLEPKLSGHLAQSTLYYGQNKARWFVNANEDAVVQMWGEPFIAWSGEDTLSTMDQKLRALIQQNQLVFKVDPRQLKIDSGRTIFSGGGALRYITYQRYLPVEDQMVPVDKAYVMFRFNKNRLIQITNYSYGEIGPVEAGSIAPEDAIQAVKDDIKFVESFDRIEGQPRPVLQSFYGMDKKVHFRFVFQVTVRKFSTASLWNYSVSASDAKIVRIGSELHTNNVGAYVYPRLPVQELVFEPLTEAIVQNWHEQTYSDENGEFVLNQGKGTASLQGLRAKIRPNKKDVPFTSGNSEGDISFSASDYISESMAYVHISKVNAFVRNFLSTGTADRPGFLEKPIVVNTQLNVKRDCNAWFDTREKTLNFLPESQRCVNSSHIADIIYHEWGHALDQALGGIQDSAFSEGIGDIIATLMTGDPQLAPGFVKSQAGAPIRDMRQLFEYPKHRGTEVHQEGQIIGGAWYDFLGLMISQYGMDDGHTKTASLFFKHLLSADDYLESYLAALVVDDDNGNLGDCTPNMCLMNRAFARHGLVDVDPRCSDEGMTLFGRACADSTVY